MPPAAPRVAAGTPDRGFRIRPLHQGLMDAHIDFVDAGAQFGGLSCHRPVFEASEAPAFVKWFSGA